MKDIEGVMLSTLGKYLNQTAVFPCYSWKVQCILKLCKRYVVFYVKQRDTVGSIITKCSTHVNVCRLCENCVGYGTILYAILLSHSSEDI